MEYRRLGQWGLEVSALGLGSWTTYGRQVGDEAALACLTAAYDAGVNLFDTAEGYADGRAEEILGRVFRTRGWPRASLVISTKVFFGGDGPNRTGLSAKHVMEGCHASLRRLQVDYIDLYLCHRPDPHTPVAETVRAMDTLIRQGKVLYWGTSEWPAERIREADAYAREHHLFPPCAEQSEYSLLRRERVEEALAPVCADLGVGLATYAPLFGGVLTGKYLEGVPRDSRAAFREGAWVRRHLAGAEGQADARRVRALVAIAQDLGTTPARLALAWCLRNPRVSSVLTGATAPEQVRDNLGALALLKALDEGVVRAVEEAARTP
jgi:voltage-dependent potassium channel beta subunit